MTRTTCRGPRRVRRAGGVAAALVASAALAGCAAQASTGSGAGDARPIDAEGGDAAQYVRNSRWVPERITHHDTEYVRPKEATNARLVLLPDPAESHWDTGSSAGCNSMDTETSLHGDVLRVEITSLTEKGCWPESVMEFERAFTAFFDGELSFAVEDADGAGVNEPATLTLTNAVGDTMLLTEIPGDPVFGNGADAAAYLTDSRWLIDYLFIDDAGIGRPEQVTDAYLELRAGHGKEDFQRSHAMAGCNLLLVATTVHGEALRVRLVASTDMACADEVMLFEWDFLDVFDGDLSFRIRDEDGPGANRPADLRLTNAAGDAIALTEDLSGQS